MRFYAVFFPAGGSFKTRFENAKLVRQGFDWEAFLITPIWAARKQMWLAFGLLLVWTAMSIVLTLALHLGAGSAFLLYFVGALAFGFESDRLCESHLAQADFLLQGLALGASRQDAELIYFYNRANEISRQAPTAGGEASDQQVMPIGQSGGTMDLLGLFPHGGASA